MIITSLKVLDEKLRLARIVLRAVQAAGQIHYSALMKTTMMQCGTDATFKSILTWLLEKNYLKRVKRGVYEITPEGVKFLEIP